MPNDGMTSWNNEVFIHYQSKKNLAFEGGISHTTRDLDDVTYNGCFGYTGSKVESLNIRYTSLNIGLQYKINPPSCMKCSLWDRLSDHVGVSLVQYWQILLQNTH